MSFTVLWLPPLTNFTINQQSTPHSPFASSGRSLATLHPNSAKQRQQSHSLNKYHCFRDHEPRAYKTPTHLTLQPVFFPKNQREQCTFDLTNAGNITESRRRLPSHITLETRSPLRASQVITGEDDGYSEPGLGPARSRRAEESRAGADGVGRLKRLQI